MNPTRRAALLLYISLTLSLSAQPSLKSARFAMPEGVAWIPGWVVVKFQTGAVPPCQGFLVVRMDWEGLDIGQIEVLQYPPHPFSEVAQWKRGGPITLRS